MNCDLKPREPMCKLRWHVPYIECVSVGLKVLCYWSYLCMKSMSESYWILLLGSHFLGVPMNLCRSVLELKDFNVYSICLSLDVLSIETGILSILCMIWTGLGCWRFCCCG